MIINFIYIIIIANKLICIIINFVILKKNAFIYSLKEKKIYQNYCIIWNCFFFYKSNESTSWQKFTNNFRDAYLTYNRSSLTLGMFFFFLKTSVRKWRYCGRSGNTNGKRSWRTVNVVLDWYDSMRIDDLLNIRLKFCSYRLKFTTIVNNRPEITYRKSQKLKNDFRGKGGRVEIIHGTRVLAVWLKKKTFVNRDTETRPTRHRRTPAIPLPFLFSLRVFHSDISTSRPTAADNWRLLATVSCGGHVCARTDSCP